MERPERKMTRPGIDLDKMNVVANLVSDEGSGEEVRVTLEPVRSEKGMGSRSDKGSGEEVRVVGSRAGAGAAYRRSDKGSGEEVRVALDRWMRREATKGVERKCEYRACREGRVGRSDGVSGEEVRGAASGCQRGGEEVRAKPVRAARERRKCETGAQRQGRSDEGSGEEVRR